ncbi:MAG: dihydrolipoamide acetyltransferase family protein [Candidatus Omnitrophota bacterium]
MRYIFKFPDIGEGITEGKILEWYVKKGQEVNSGDSLLKVETDKVVTDLPSPRTGVIVTLFGNEGDVISVEYPLVELEIEGISPEEAQAMAKEKPAPAKKEPIEEKGFGVVGTIEVAGDSAFLPASDENAPPTTPEEEAPPEKKKVMASPVARAMAKEWGVDIERVKGTGPAGRIMKADIEHYYEKSRCEQTPPPPKAAAEAPRAQPAPDRITYEPLSQIRKTIARNMLRSKQSTAHMTAMDDVEVSELVRIYETYLPVAAEKGVKLSYLPFILKAVVHSLMAYPALNAELDMENERMVLKHYYNIGIAVDTAEGLVVPVIRDVERLSIMELAARIAETAQRARDRKLTLDDFKDGTFTVTNYGSIGGTYGVPVINYPQVAILGVGRIMKKPILNVNNEIVVGHLMPLSLSVDHRIVDGAQAARFLTRIMDYLKDPVSLMII